MAAPRGYVQHDEVLTVPKGTGIEGFLRSLREVLKLPNVQDVRITRQGTIEYTFFLREGEEKRVIMMNFDSLMPMALVRNAEVVEVPSIDGLMTPVLAPHAIMRMFELAAADHLLPIAFVTGASSLLWKWLDKSPTRRTDGPLFGLPVHSDRNCPDEALLLCAAFKKDSELVDMKKAYKIAMPVMP